MPHRSQRLGRRRPAGRRRGRARVGARASPRSPDTTPARRRAATRVVAAGAGAVAHCASATFTRPSLAQQRHRLELQPSSSIERPARGRKNDRAQLGARRARRPISSPVVQRRAAARRSGRGRRAACRRRWRRPASLPADADRGERAVGELADRLDVEPRGRRRRRGHHHRQLHPGGRRRAAGDHRQPGPRRLRRDALDLEALEVGRRLLERLLDRELERHRRGRAVRAAAAQVDPRDPVLERQQLDVAAVGLHVRPHRVERVLHPLLERDRMQVVDQQQRRDQLVVGERGRDPLAVRAGVEQRADDPLQAGAVHLHDRRDELLGELARAPSRRSARAAPGAPGPARRAARASSVDGRPPCPSGYASAVGVCMTFRTLPLAGVHVHAARQARVERAHRPHDVDRP